MTKNREALREIRLAEADYEVRDPKFILPFSDSEEVREPWTANIKYLLSGTVFGIIMVKSEVLSWFRIQEMFRLQSFHMYGVIGMAVVTAMLSVLLLKKFRVKTWKGEPIIYDKKRFNMGQIYGGLIFGLGWAITGACPGPLLAQIGSGATAIFITFLSAVAGTWVFGRVREKLPV
jgi:uncharacterized membrane protein YedE/YeeE